MVVWSHDFFSVLVGFQKKGIFSGCQVLGENTIEIHWKIEEEFADKNCHEGDTTCMNECLSFLSTTLIPWHLFLYLKVYHFY